MKELTINTLLDDVINRLENKELPVIDPVVYDKESGFTYINSICANIDTFEVKRLEDCSKAEVLFCDGTLERVTCMPTDTFDRILTCSIAQHVGKEIYTAKGITLLAKKLASYKSVIQIIDDAKATAIKDLFEELM